MKVLPSIFTRLPRRRPVSPWGYLYPAIVWIVLLLVPGEVLAAPPLLKALQPRGIQRGTTLTLTLVGEGLTTGAEVMTTIPGSLARLLPPKDLAEPGTQLPFLLEVPADAPVGLYPIRIRSQEGLSNLLLFAVGDLPEIVEQEPNDAPARAQPIKSPVTVNGNLGEADRDYFRFSARKGERLVFEVEARRAGSALDPVIQILGADGREIAYDHDTPGLNVDCRVEVKFATSGDYFVQVHDARFSGQEENFYRLKMGTFAYADGLFPLGWQRGGKVEVTLFGGNLSDAVTLTPNLDVPPSIPNVLMPLPGSEPQGSLPFRFVLSDLPEAFEPEEGSPRILEPATVINARISRPGEVDKYRLRVTPGQRWIVELQAASLGTSRLDSVLNAEGAQGKRLASVDDFFIEAFPPPPRTLDARLDFEVPKDPDLSEVVITVEDLQNHGGPAYGYRLLARPKTPDFELELVEPYINVPANGSASVSVRVKRHGYDGPIQLGIPAELSEDLTLQGGYIPPAVKISESTRAGREGIFTLTARPGAETRAVELEVWGEGSLDGRTLRRRARGPGIITVVKGSHMKEDPIFGLQPVDYQPFRADWMGLSLPAAITRSVPLRLQPAQNRIRVFPGMSREIQLQVDGKVPVPLELKFKGGSTALDPRSSKGTISAGAEQATATLKVRGRAIHGRLNLVLEGTGQVDGKKFAVESEAFDLEIVPSHSIELLSPKAEIAPGGKVELKGVIRRDPSAVGPVKLKFSGLPQQVSCAGAEVPGDRSEFRTICQAEPAAKSGEFEIDLASSTEIGIGEEKHRYTIDPVKLRLIISDPGVAQAPGTPRKDT